MPLYTRTHARTPAHTDGLVRGQVAEWQRQKLNGKRPKREREPNELESNRKKELELELELELVYQGKRDGPSERAIKSQ